MMNASPSRFLSLLVPLLAAIALSSVAACGLGNSPATHITPQTPGSASGSAAVARSPQPTTTRTAVETASGELAKQLMRSRGIVGVGVGEYHGAPCIRVYLVNDSAALKAKVPALFHGFKVVVEVTGPIEALPAVALSGQKLPQSKVELDVFSGRPNPTWTLAPALASDLQDRITRLAPSTRVGPSPQNLGYRGFIVQSESGSSSPVATVRAFHGLVTVTTASGTACYVDPERRIELWLLSTAQPPLQPDLNAQIVQDITKNAP